MTSPFRTARSEAASRLAGQTTKEKEAAAIGVGSTLLGALLGGMAGGPGGLAAGAAAGAAIGGGVAGVTGQPGAAAGGQALSSGLTGLDRLIKLLQARGVAEGAPVVPGASPGPK